MGNMAGMGSVGKKPKVVNGKSSIANNPPGPQPAKTKSAKGVGSPPLGNAGNNAGKVGNTAKAERYYSRSKGM